MDQPESNADAPTTAPHLTRIADRIEQLIMVLENRD
jgi:hypothetical protein